jgi:hypothetical protein
VGHMAMTPVAMATASAAAIHTHLRPDGTEDAIVASNGVCDGCPACR